MNTNSNSDNGHVVAVTGAVTGNANHPQALVPPAALLDTGMHQDDDECGCARLDNGECGCLRDR